MTELVLVAGLAFMKRTISYGKCSSHNQKPDFNKRVKVSLK